MFHFFEAIQNKSGDALPGYLVKVFDSTGTIVPIYSDNAGTPIINVSEIADTAVVDDSGNVSLYVEHGTYDLGIYSPSGSQILLVNDVPMGASTVTLASGAAVATRALMAAIASPAALQQASLTEAGREGTFVFDDSDLSAQVTIDTAQGIYIAPSTDTTGASGAWVRAFDGHPEGRWFGVKADGTTDDKAALQTAFGTVSALGYDAIRLAASTHRLATNLTIDESDLAILAEGATLSSDLTTNVEAITISGSNVSIQGATLLCPSGSTAYNNITGPNCHLENCTVTRAADTNTIQMYARETADGFRMTGCRFTNANAACAILCSDVLIQGNEFISSAGGDDALPIRAITATTENIRIIGNRFVNHAAGLTIGSTVGTPGADDATYSKAARNIIFLGNTLEGCARLAYIKPGGIASSDYRNGLVENVVISNNTLEDRSGTYLTAGISITAGRAAWIRNVKGENNLIVGRTFEVNESNGRKRVLDIYGTTDGGKPTIEDIDVGFSFIDPYDGAANSGSAPGYPLFNIATCVNDNANGITARNIHIRCEGNGCQFTGIDISDEFDGAVWIDRARLKNINTTATGAAKGIRTQSANTYLGTDISISMSSGSAYGVLGVGTFKAAYATDHSSLSTASEARTNLGLGTALAAATNFSSGYVLGSSAVAIPNPGNTTENTLVTVTIPAGAMGANGLVIVEAIWTVPNNANNKTMRTKFGGSNVNVQTVTTQQSYTQRVRIRNRNSASSQICPPSGLSTGEGFSTAANVTTAINTANATDIVLSAQCANAADTITLEEYTVMVFPKA